MACQIWTSIIGYVPVISSLMCDWYCFHFLTTKDASQILCRPWVQKCSFLALYKWYLGFNPLKNTLVNNLIWVKCPNIPLELWTNEALELIGNEIGRFIYVDPWCRGERDKRIAWILIQHAYKGGFPDHLEISWKDQTISQRLDFWGIPFRCAACKNTGHLVKNCPSAKLYKTRCAHRMFLNGSQSPPPSPVKIRPQGRPSPPCRSAYDFPLSANTPPYEPFDVPPVPSPLPVDLKNFSTPLCAPPPIIDSAVGSVPIPISSSSPLPRQAANKGKGIAPVGPTPPNSPFSSPVNLFDNDLDLLHTRASLQLEPLTIHKPGLRLPVISPESGKNITVRRKGQGSSRHFGVRTNDAIRNLSLVEVPVIEDSPSQPLRACKAANSPK